MWPSDRSVAGRIGETGQLFLIGERYVGTPPTGGKLYLRIAEGPWGVVGSGSFNVKINDDGLSPRAELMPAPREGAPVTGPLTPPAVPLPPPIPDVPMAPPTPPFDPLEVPRN